ncbi:carboxypeptidase-like regulatory domain-containing protein [Pedobacter endophyticus]|uniref:Carboxypeptidase regulatory-like domain-containing protein n=1 Tax=Pedobacter endophyticus TaxID=2789740 RepID=A0A7U3Q5H0_9SPHI|nr:carboxypeptidase-like regulatory domain-containing protein [Pedobacter endophyticus]QPH38107.1 carboxypeptidase regulatory-like domain-containing protein [Pedobacter endophyticus]
MRLKPIFLFIFFATWSISIAYAQSGWYGTVTDSSSNPIAYVNVALLNNGIILSYTTSDKVGKYLFDKHIKDNTLCTHLQFTAVGYKKKTVALTKPDRLYNVVLDQSLEVLSEILVKAKPAPIKKQGDTTNFDLAFYKAPQDRVIEDVLKKIPGIEITDAGKISYNGKAITSFFIDGDNLLDDKYALGTRTIPPGMVDTLQVFENHQPIKALNNISPSDNVSLNIVLNPKARIKFTGFANLGLATRAHFKEEANLMSFKKDYKTLNIMKYNSDGYDLSKDITAQNFLEKNNDLSRNINYPLIDLNIIAAPNINPNKYLFNRALLTSTNQLFKLKNDVQLKLSGHYFNDRQRSNLARLTEKIISADTIRFFEELSQNYKPQNVALRGDLTINKKNYYFNNTLRLKSENTNVAALITVNAEPVKQDVRTKPYELYNEANFIKTFGGNKATEFFSFLSKSDNRQKLTLTPAVINGYSNQQIETPQLFVTNSLAFKVSTGKLSQEYKIAHIYDEKEINSAINEIYTNGLGNGLKWKYNRLQFNPFYSYLNNKVRISLGLPVSYNSFSYGDRLFSSNEHHVRFLIEPKFALKINHGKENRITAQYQYKNDFGDASTQYRGYILANYRTLNAYDTNFLSQSNTHHFSAGYNFSKSISLFSFNVLGFYSVKERNAINQISFSGFNETTMQLPLVNYNRNLLLMANTNQYIFALKTTLKANVALQQLYTNQLLNSELMPYKTKTYTCGIGTDTKFSDAAYLKFSASFVPIRSKATAFDFSERRSEFLNQKIELVLLPRKSIVFKINGEHQYYNSTISQPSNYLFLDAGLSLKFAKVKQELTLSAINLTNVKSYRNTFLAAYTSSTTNYQLLGRFFQANYSFNF